MNIKCACCQKIVIVASSGTKIRKGAIAVYCEPCDVERNRQLSLYRMSQVLDKKDQYPFGDIFGDLFKK